MHQMTSNLGYPDPGTVDCPDLGNGLQNAIPENPDTEAIRAHFGTIFDLCLKSMDRLSHRSVFQCNEDVIHRL